ncbi:MAG: hypothetical protein QOK16_329 [Solirubrobacteraceae bacterium]|nr:hypothetical protein [Solirubrobacteraceae bacterium]
MLSRPRLLPGPASLPVDVRRRERSRPLSPRASPAGAPIRARRRILGRDGIRQVPVRMSDGNGGGRRVRTSLCVGFAHSWVAADRNDAAMIDRLDHLVLTVADRAATVAFYERAGHARRTLRRGSRGASIRRTEAQPAPGRSRVRSQGPATDSAIGRPVLHRHRASTDDPGGARASERNRRGRPR